MEDAGLYARESDRLGRAVQIGVAGGKAISVSFPASPPADASPDHPLLDRVFDYLDGAEDHFDDVPVALTVSADHRRALDAVRKVPHGETVGADRIATLAGFDTDDEAAVATVREALAENPAPLFVPDHRVEGSAGATPREVAERLRAIERGG